MVIRASKKERGDVSLHSAIGTDKEGGEISLIDILDTKDDEIIDEIHHKMQVVTLYKVIEKDLDEWEYDVICSRYGLFDQDSKTQREIAKKLGISRSYVSRIEKRALEKLKKHF